MTQEISKQVAYVLSGQSFSLAVPKQVDYTIQSYPFQDISKQVDYGLMQDQLVQVAKQVVYALIEPRISTPVRRTSSSSFTFQYGRPT
jgi:hypothetical protein